MKHQTYIHDIPGRLRVRTDAIRKRPAAASAARALIAGTPHVHSVEANPLTGSIIVQYDHARLGAPALLAILRRNGYLEGMSAERRTAAGAKSLGHPATARMTPTQKLMMEAAAAQVGQIVVRWAIKRALTAGIAALL